MPLRALFNKSFRGLLVGIFCLAALLPLSGGAAAQSPSDGWSEPINLSNAGSSTDPLIVVDSERTTHVIWFDEYAGARYTKSVDGVQWSAPVSLAFPFREIRPRLMRGPDDYIYAYWIGQDGSLNSSRVLGMNFGIVETWEPARLLAPNTLSFDVILQPDGVFHVVSLMGASPTEPTPGIYYRQSAPGGNGWVKNILIYSSPYFRGMTVGQSHVRITMMPTGDTETIFIAWDDLALRKVFMSSSTDNGETWETPLEIDAPTSTSGSAAPFDVEMTTWNGQTLLIWKKGASSSDCDILYQAISEDGESWSAPKEMFTNLPGCPSSLSKVADRSDLMLWQATTNNQIYLSAWNGSQWSPPQIQSDLSGLKDPVTARMLSLASRQMVYVSDENRLESVASDVDGNLDIWYSSQELNDNLDEWFPPPSAWEAPQQLITMDSGIHDLNVVADSDGGFHALWIQPPLGNFENKSANVYYSHGSEGAWTQPNGIQRMRSGNITQLTVGLNARNEMLAIWQGDDPGGLYFSSTSAARAFRPVEWLEMSELPTPEGLASDPYLLAADNEMTFVAYAVPVNEGRGIYLNRSDDARTWSAPVQIFDAQAAQWDTVGKPKLFMTADGRLHALWEHASLMNPSTGLGLGYAFSDDNGDTWSQANLEMEGAVQWSGITAPSADKLVRVWLEASDQQPIIVTQFSSDNGMTWSAPVSITTGNMQTKPSLVTDPAGTAHLLLLNGDRTSRVVLRHWIWVGEDWQAGESLDLGEGSAIAVEEIHSVISDQQRITVLLSTSDTLTGTQFLQAVTGSAGAEAPSASTEPGSPTPTAEMTAASIEAAATEAALTDETAAAGEIAAPTDQPSATPLPSPSPTPDLNSGAVNGGGSQDSWAGVILGSILAIFIVAAAFGYRVWRIRQRVPQRKSKY